MISTCLCKVQRQLQQGHQQHAGPCHLGGAPSQASQALCRLTTAQLRLRLCAPSQRFFQRPPSMCRPRVGLICPKVTDLPSDLSAGEVSQSIGPSNASFGGSSDRCLGLAVHISMHLSDVHCLKVKMRCCSVRNAPAIVVVPEGCQLKDFIDHAGV